MPPKRNATQSLLEQKLQSVVAVEYQQALASVLTRLWTWLDSDGETNQTSAEPPNTLAVDLAALANNEPGTLAEIQQILVGVLSGTDRDHQGKLSALLAATTTAFADSDNRSPLGDGPSQPDYRPSGGDRVWDDDFLQQIIDTVGDPIFVKDEDHRWIFLNDAYCDFMGYSRQELLGKSDYDFFPREEADIFWEKDNLVFSTGETDENEESFTDADGNEHVIITKKTMFVDSRGRKILVGVIRDITERKRLENRLAVAKRLMSLGTLAGGVAHEINNPLSFVLANLEFLNEALDDPDEPPEELRAALDTAVRGAERVRDIVDGLEAFSRSEEELEPVDLRESLKTSVQLAANEIRHRAQLVEDYGDIPLIDANHRSLGQIFLNLLINATQALSTGNADDNEIRVATTTDDDGRAVVEIADTGVGIDDEDLEHIFDPFFSTKPVGQGTGLGLSVTHTLVDALDGHIDVDSEPGRGTSFRLVFPPSERSAGSRSSSPAAASPSGEKPHLLLIDDSPEVLVSMQRRLKRFFAVDTCSSTADALHRLETREEEYDLVVCDVMMPEKNGRDFRDALARHTPRYLERLVFVSGGVFDPELREFLSQSDHPVLDKFFDVTDLQDQLKN